MSNSVMPVSTTAEKESSHELGIHTEGSSIMLDKVAWYAFVLGTLTIIAYSLKESSLAILMAYLVFGVLGLTLVWRSGVTGRHIYMTVLGFSTVAIIVLTLSYIREYGVPHINAGSDVLMYEMTGKMFAKGFGIFDYNAIRGNVVSEGHNSVGFVYLVGLFVKLSDNFDGYHTIVPRLFNSVCLGLISVLIFTMGQRLGLQRKTTVVAALFSGCMPLMVSVASDVLRDIVQSLLIMTIIFLWIVDSRGKWRYPVPVLLLLSAPLMLVIWEIRAAQVFVIIIIISIALLTNYQLFKPVQLVSTLLPIIILGAYFAYQFKADVLMDVEHYFGSIDRYAMHRLGNVSYIGMSNIVFEEPLFPIGWLYRTAYALVSPLPVAYETLYSAWTSLGTIIHILFIPFLLLGLKGTASALGWRTLASTFVLLFIGMAMFTFTDRHMTQFLPFAILLAARGVENYENHPLRVWLFMGLAGASLAIIYVSLRFF